MEERREHLVESELVYAHSLAAVVMLFVAAGFGFLAATELVVPDVAGGSQFMSWGRLRYDHTQGILFGWLGNAFLASLYHMVPVMTGRRVTSLSLGRLLFGIWNFLIVIPGWILVLNGISQPLEWAEFPVVVDVFVMIAVVFAIIQFLPGFFRQGMENMYVSAWYIVGGLVFTAFSYPMGNFLPQYVPGARGAAFSGLWIHDAVGLFITPLALSIIYFVIPASTRRPIYSHFLSMLGFWLLFFLYPLNGTHHYVFSVIPMTAQKGAILASGLLGVDVLIVVTNLVLSMRGSGWFPRDLALRFVGTGTILYLIVSIQGSLQAQMDLNAAIHFSDWVVGHAHLAMLGFATFAAAGGLVHAWRHVPFARFNRGVMEMAYWFLLAGVALMFTDLTAAGIVEAGIWGSAAPWLESVRAAKPYWALRMAAGIPLLMGFLIMLAAMLTGDRPAVRSEDLQA